MFIIMFNNNFNEDLDKQLNKNSNQIEEKSNDFWNFSDEQASDELAKPTPNFEL